MPSSLTQRRSVPHQPNVAVVVETNDPRLVAESSRIKEMLQRPSEGVLCILHFGENGVSLRATGQKNSLGFQVDFSTIDRRIGAGNLSRQQPFPKAIGKKNKTVVDATAGFGMDAARLALMGYQVTAIERSPIVAAMLRDGIHRANQDREVRDALGGRLVFEEAESSEFLRVGQPPEVVYIDTMFPPKKKKSALPPGHIQILQSIVGFDNADEEDQLFQVALNTATNRIVVKRPIHAPHIGEHPVAIHQGKLVRYEVYKPE